MTRFEKEYFRPFSFSNKEIDRYFQNALRDLKIAKTDLPGEAKDESLLAQTGHFCRPRLFGKDLEDRREFYGITCCDAMACA